MTKKKTTVILTKDAIIAKNDLPKKIVSVPEWGGSVYVRSLTAADRDHYEASIVNGDDTKFENIRARFLSLCIVDEDGTRLFTSAKDVTALGQKSSAALDRVWGVAKNLNKISKEDIEELAKN